MSIFIGQLEFEACEAVNEVSAEAVEQANQFLRAAISAPGFGVLEQTVRMAVAKSFQKKQVTGNVKASLTPFIYASRLDPAVFEQLALAIVQHRDRSEIAELLGEESAEIMQLVDGADRWPIGFFACTRLLQGADREQTTHELVPYVASPCLLGQCGHLSPRVQAALQHPQAKRWPAELGRLLVGNAVVFRPLSRDRQLDEKTRQAIEANPDCLVVTEFSESSAKSFLLAEPFRSQ